MQKPFTLYNVYNTKHFCLADILLQIYITLFMYYRLLGNTTG